MDNKNKRKKNNNKKNTNVTYNTYNELKDNDKFSSEELISIMEEAYYRALMRADNDKNKEQSKGVAVKYKWYENILFFLNVLFWPFKIKDTVE